MVIDHIGIVTPSLKDSIRQWKDVFGYAQLTKEVINTRQKVKVVFMQKANSLTVKLIEPTDETSPIYRFAKKGGGLHHLCMKVNDINVEIDILKNNGCRLINPPEPGEAFDNNSIAFLLAANNLNIELIDTDKKVPIPDKEKG